MVNCTDGSATETIEHGRLSLFDVYTRCYPYISQPSGQRIAHDARKTLVHLPGLHNHSHAIDNGEDEGRYGIRLSWPVALNDTEDFCCNHIIAILQSSYFRVGQERRMMREVSEHLRSTAETVDLWEHACLLYHSYEWQSAADAFLDLEEHTSNPGDKCIFALNRGLIEARLGDLDIVLTSFSNALGHDMANPVAHFLLGLAHAETRNYAKAKMQFETCLSCLGTNEHNHQTYLGSFNLEISAVQENIDHMRSRLVATAAGHGRTSHLRTHLHVLPADVLFEPHSGSTQASTRHSKSSTERGDDFKSYEFSDERLQDPISRARQPLHVAGHGVNSLHLVKDADKNLTIAPLAETVNEVRRDKRLAPRDPRVRDGDTQELARFLRHAGPSGDTNVTVDRKYMQRLLQGHPGDRAPVYSNSQVSTPVVHSGDEFESLLGLYTGAPSARRPSVSATIGSSASETTTVRQNVYPGQSILERGQGFNADRERPLGSRRPTLETAQRWLRKEVRPPWVYNPTDSDRDVGNVGAVRDLSRGTMSNDDRDGQSLPSVVSSTEMFMIGRPRKGER